MKKFVFSLDKVMNFKQQNLDVLTNEMQQLNSALINTESMIENNEFIYKSTGKKMEENMATGMTIQEITNIKTYMHALLVKIDRLKVEKINLESAISNKKDQVIQVRSDIKGLEKLREKQLKEYNKSVQKDFEQTIEEYVVQKSS